MLYLARLAVEAIDDISMSDQTAATSRSGTLSSSVRERIPSEPLASFRNQSVTLSLQTNLEQSSAGSMYVQWETAGIGTGIGIRKVGCGST